MFTVSLVHLALWVIFIYNLLDLVEHEKCNNLEISVDDRTQCSKRKDWCYQSQMSCTQSCKGPAAWNEMTRTCGGNRQSPINIVTKKTKQDSSLTAFKFTDYDKTFNTMLKNTGETVSLDIPLGASVSGGNLSQTYNAFQLHFHWGNNGSSGSEHTLDGEQYPMEMHILHIKDTYITVEDVLNDTTGQAILGFFFEESDRENKNYNAFIAALAQVQDAEREVEVAITLSSLIPPEKKLSAYYRYEGSRTIPGCSETVVWTIFEQPIPLSKAQLAAFSNLKFKDGKPMVDTFRPVQPRKGRVVYRSHSGAAGTAIMVSFTLVLLCVTAGLSCYQFY
ncbi:carbonic anhydrase 4-like [Neoarius graeffei]|uniref:carbonic anhydrase 4-like n=1 Tax=Neoarius graeffei TaxID=443677 RepID=UPI00298D5DCE|nr:carbonic anhydrase 4-like [Neoarius graeffei]